ncbi:MAG: cytochrome c oxidase subunit II [Rhodospirillales bacterium]
MIKRFALFAITAMTGLAVAAGEALAQQYRSEPWQMWFQTPRSPSAERINEFHNLVFFVEAAIVIFVLALMAYITIRFTKKRNPVPSKTTHNTLLEVIWTGVPILILVVIAVPSLKLLYYVDAHPDPDMTIKVIGNQWYWSYEYPDHGEIAFDSILIPEEDLQPGQPRLLTVDNPLVVPANTNIRVLQTSNDVIHNWAVPALMLKLDNTPGRVNETWFNIKDEGTYYGMCSELCGVNHGFMPIQVEAVSQAEFEAWVTRAQEQFAENGDIPDIYAVLEEIENNDNRLAQLAE